MSSALAGMPVEFSEHQEAQPVAFACDRRVPDPVGMWYVARAQRGQDDRMWFALYREGNRIPRWHTCSHRYSDGIGAISLLLREQQLPGLPLPRGRDAAPPDWRTLLGRRDTAPQRNIDLQWKRLDVSRRASPGHAPVSELLDAAVTAAIEEAAAAAGVTSTVWLLWTADRALRASLAQPQSVTGWVFPVNLRGAVRSVDEFANHCSGLVITLDQGGDAEDCKLQIRERFERHEHWRQWLLLTLGRWVGQRGVNLLYRLAEPAPGRFAGSYSNLGEWNVPGLDGLAACAPGSAAYPVAVGTVLCNGRRTLSCRLHPVIGGDAGRALEFLTVWRDFATGARVARRRATVVNAAAALE